MIINCADLTAIPLTSKRIKGGLLIDQYHLTYNEKNRIIHLKIIYFSGKIRLYALSIFLLWIGIISGIGFQTWLTFIFFSIPAVIFYLLTPSAAKKTDDGIYKEAEIFEKMIMELDK